MRPHWCVSVVLIVALAAPLASGGAKASAQTINKCQAGKKKCVIKKVKGLFGCHAKAEKSGEAVEQSCFDTVREKFSHPADNRGCIEKLEAKGGCATSGDAAVLAGKIDAFVLDVVQELDPGYPAAVLNKCSAGKKKCVAKKAAGLLGCHVKAETKGVLDPNCLLKRKQRFDGALLVPPNPAKGCFEKLEATGSCLTYDDTAALEAKIDAFVDDVVCALDPALPGCPCPSTYQFTADGTATDRDMGWTGLDHDLPFTSNVGFTAGISNCAQTSVPCGECALSGPIPNAGPGFQYRRCRGDSSGNNGPWITCAGDADCAGTGNACVFFLGPPQPAAVGGLAVCALYEFAGPISGTLNVESGEAAMPVRLGWRVFLGVTTLDDPCPRCVSGLCTAGPRSGQACVVDGTSARFADDVSLDCPPLSPPLFDKTLSTTLATGAQVLTLSADSPRCRPTGSGYISERCFCDTCNNAAATPCTSNADCVAVGASICGGTRCDGGANDGTPCEASSECPDGECRVPGETAPNGCYGPNWWCQPVAGDEGACDDGPIDQLCLIQSYRGCLTDADCPLAGDSCIAAARPCFLDNGAIGGTLAVTGVASPTAPTLGGLMCVPFTQSSAANAVSGFPGPARFKIPGTAVID